MTIDGWLIKEAVYDESGDLLFHGSFPRFLCSLNRNGDRNGATTVVVD